ncbi:MAG TPA: DinB family protein [Terriglobia bacterium]|nr:DinB family protein [Terriglobia bacterium]
MKRSAAVVSLVLFCLSLSSAFPQTAPTTLTPQEREQALKLFQTSRDNFLKSISGLSEKQWTFKPGPDRWSVGEVAEHITVSESTLFGVVLKSMQSPPDPAKRELAKGKDQVILAKVPDRSQKFKAPEILQPTGRWANEADLTKAFEDARQANMDYIRTTNDDLRDHFFDHPVLGPMDGYQWLLLIATHSARHTAQIEEVKADPNFPK